MKSDMKPGRLFLIYGGLFLTFLFLLLPIVWLVFSSFRSNDSIQAGQLWPAPGDFTLANYAEVFHINGLVGFLVNSIVIATATTLLVVFLGSLAAYGLSRFALRGKELFMTAALLPQFFPYVLVLIPFYVLMSNLGLVDTHFGLILTHTSITLPFGLWMLTGYFNAIPRELDQAASIDGCSRLGVLFRIIYPIAVPGLVVAGFFAFVVSWGDYLFVSILSQSQGTQTLPIALQTFMSSLTEEPPLARTHEYGAYVIEAMETNCPIRINGNVPNTRLIDNLPGGCCVEVPCLVDGNGIQPTYVGSLPAQLAALNRTNVNVQALIVEAALTGSREAVYHAVMLDPLTAAVCTLPQIRNMVDDLLAAQKRWIKLKSEAVLNPHLQPHQN
jgi:ABC-type glycerol-3-phosphate transport system permease component